MKVTTLLNHTDTLEEKSDNLELREEFAKHQVWKNSSRREQNRLIRNEKFARKNGLRPNKKTMKS